jgi:prophage maintenance system killer protein
MDSLIIYQSADNNAHVEIRFEGETFWLTQEQIATLFERDRTVISKHLKNIFKTGELAEKVVCAKFAHTTPHGAMTDKTQEMETKYYNLDAIISVGYRINSKRGTQFRQWATQRLKDYLVQGYSVNQKRLDELGKMVQLIAKSGASDEVQLSEAKGLLEILGNYTKSFSLLNQYDTQQLRPGTLSKHITYEIEYGEAIGAVVELRKQLVAKKQASYLFGNEKDESFRSSLKSIVQTFDGEYVYASIEEQAAHLLYFVIKNHSFTDGNKRIGAFLFVWFLEKNRHRFKKSGELKINDNGLTAIALLVAQSNPLEKEILIQLIVALIADSL